MMPGRSGDFDRVKIIIPVRSLMMQPQVSGPPPPATKTLYPPTEDKQ